MSAAFKEWALVCEALGNGRQSIILRKGGIAEGRAGFSFRHDEFFLFPTWFHEQLSKTNLPPETELPEQSETEIEIRYAASVEWTRLVTNLEALHRMRDFHILHDSVVEERFHYDKSEGVHVAFLRIFRLDPPCRIANEKKFGGCRSWVELPDLEDCALVSVISDEEHSERRRKIEAILFGE